MPTPRSPIVFSAFDPISDTAALRERELALDVYFAAADGDLSRLTSLLSTPEGKKAAFCQFEDIRQPTALFEAIAKSLKPCALALLPHSDPDARDENGRTPLLAALAAKAFDVAEALLPFSDARASDHDGATALMAAARMGGAEALAWIERLLPLSDAKAQTHQGTTALMWAAIQGSENSLRALLPRSDIEAQDSNDNTALLVAAASISERCVAVLAPISFGGQTNRQGHSALSLAVERHAYKIVDTLIPLVDWRIAPPKHRDAFGVACDNMTWRCADAIAAHATAQGQTVPCLRETMEDCAPGDFPRTRAALEAQAIQQAMAAGSLSGHIEAAARRAPRAL